MSQAAQANNVATPLLRKLYYSKRARLLGVGIVLILGFGLDSISYRTSTVLITGGTIGSWSAVSL